MKSTLILSFLVVSICLLGQVPGTLSYQGILMQSDGITPITDGAHSIVFNFYTAPSGGSSLFSRTVAVTTAKGLYTCIVGGGTAPNAALNSSEINQIGAQQIFIGINVDAGGELSPRAQLTPSAYAFQAQSAYTISDAAVTTLKLADGAVTNVKIASGIDASKITTGTLSGATILLTGTGSSKLASGTTAQRPGSPAEGQIRYNTTEKVMEFFNGTSWVFMTPKIAILTDSVASSVDGGSSIAGWKQRRLTVLRGDNSFVSLLSNQFTLSPGQYIIEAIAPAYRVLQHKCRLYDITNSSAKILGTSELTEDVANTTGNHSHLSGFLLVTSPTIYELQQYGELANPTNGFGQSTTGDGHSEIYSIVKITKLR